MTDIEQPLASIHADKTLPADSWRFGLIALIAFLTLVDLFAAQAVLPSLVERFEVSRATMGLAVNASTLGMAIAGLLVAFFGGDVDRRNGIWISLALLSIPTTLLAFTDNILVFAALRVLQGLCMSTAFTLTAAYLSEHFSAGETSGALAAYVTGNVASNLFGRMLSAAIAGIGGLSLNFLIFAGLNLLGAALVWFSLKKTASMMRTNDRGSVARHIWRVHLADPDLRRVFLIGFLILFVFIGTYLCELPDRCARRGTDGAWPCLSCLSPFDCDHAVCREDRKPCRVESGNRIDPCNVRPRPRGASQHKFANHPRRIDAGGNRHVPGASYRHRHHRPACHERQGRCQRHLSGILLHRRHDRQSGSRTGL
ncbi:hypothetical protein FHX03_000883 [Rhizobium sp. BK456]|nr:hypothetical protein [Rhizobium sp. BK456]